MRFFMKIMILIRPTPKNTQIVPLGYLLQHLKNQYDDINHDYENCVTSPIPFKSDDENSKKLVDGDKTYPPDVLRKQLPILLHENQEGFANPSVVNSCKFLPLPMTPSQSNENEAKDQDVQAPPIKPISPKQQKKDTLSSAKKLPLSPKSPKPNCPDVNQKTEFGKDEYSNSTHLPVSPSNIPLKHDEKSSEHLCDSPNENLLMSSDSSVDSVYNGSDFYGTVPGVMSEDLRDTFKGSDFNSSDIVSIDLGDTHKGSDFISLDNLEDTHQG